MTRASLIASLRIVLVTAAVLARNAGAAQIIPVDRTFGQAWQNSGHPGEIPSPARIVNVRESGARGDGDADDGPPIARAIESLGDAPGVVFFPAGTYLLHSAVNVPAGAVLRGEGSGKTTLRWDHPGSCINIARAQSGVFQAVMAGHSVHSGTLVVTDGTAFAPGDYAEIRADNDPAWRASTWANKVVGQILRITGVSGNQLTLERALRITYERAQNPEIRKIVPITEAGVESLKVERLLAGTSPTQRDNVFTIKLDYAARCWVRGVEGFNAFGGHVALVSSTQCAVTGSYFHHAHEYDGGGSGYGVRLEFKTGECRIEDNIFQHLRHSMLVQAGANGNVFGYNYSRDPVRTEFPSEISGDIVLHGNYPFANLFEGNICQHIWIDASHGTNGPLNTFFRNRAEAYGFTMTDPAAHRQNIVGNETFKGRWSVMTGGGYSLAGTGHFEFANNTQGKGIQPPDTAKLADFSYYLHNDPSLPPPLPAFWKIAAGFPPVGLPLALDAVKNIPARARFFSNGNFTVAPPK
jgi:hypothetical protein